MIQLVEIVMMINNKGDETNIYIYIYLYIYKVRVSDKMVKQINTVRVFQSVTFNCLVHQFPSAPAAQTVSAKSLSLTRSSLSCSRFSPGRK